MGSIAGTEVYTKHTNDLATKMRVGTEKWKDCKSFFKDALGFSELESDDYMGKNCLDRLATSLFGVQKRAAPTSSTEEKVKGGPTEFLGRDGEDDDDEDDFDDDAPAGAGGGDVEASTKETAAATSSNGKDEPGASSASSLSLFHPSKRRL